MYLGEASKVLFGFKSLSCSMNALESPPVGGDYSRGPAIKVISLVTFAFVALCTVLRMIGRIFITKRTGWDDYTMLLALVVTDKVPWIY